MAMLFDVVGKLRLTRFVNKMHRNCDVVKNRGWRPVTEFFLQKNYQSFARTHFLGAAVTPIRAGRTLKAKFHVQPTAVRCRTSRDLFAAAEALVRMLMPMKPSCGALCT